MQERFRTRVLAGCSIYKNYLQKVKHRVSLEISIYALTVSSECYNSRIIYLYYFLITYGVCNKRKYCNRMSEKKILSF